MYSSASYTFAIIVAKASNNQGHVRSGASPQGLNEPAQPPGSSETYRRMEFALHTFPTSAKIRKDIIAILNIFVTYQTRAI